MTRRGAALVRPGDHFGLLLALLLTALVLTGLDGRPARTAVAVVNSLVLLVVFRGRGTLSKGRLAVLVGLAAVGWVTASALDPDEAVGASAWLVQAGLLAIIVVVVAQRIVEHEQVTAQTIAGALSLYVLIGLLFGMVYGATEALTDDTMLMGADGSRDDPIYYSFVTLTTLGFGDVTSLSDVVRRITVVEAIVGQVFLATLVARLVSVYGTDRGQRSA